MSEKSKSLCDYCKDKDRCKAWNKQDKACVMFSAKESVGDMATIIHELAEKAEEVMYFDLVRTAVKNDEGIMDLLSSFNDVGVKWKTIGDAIIKYAEKGKGESR